MSLTLGQLESAAAVTLMATELNGLANNAGAISSVGGASGVFTNTISGGTTNLGGYPRGKLEFTMGGTVTALTAGGSIQVWWLLDVSAYENGTPPPRNPDVVIPLGALTTAQIVTRLCAVPVGVWKVYVVNSATGQSMPSSGNTLKLLTNTDQGN